jgi:apolipoprotein N-acyltransferase
MMRVQSCVTAAEMAPSQEAPPTRIRASFYPAPWRAIAVLLWTISCASLLAVLAVLLIPTGRPLNPLGLIRVVTGLCLLPGCAALLLRRAFAGVARTEAHALVLEQPHRRVDIPIDSVTAVEPWLLPLPGSGLWLRLRSGRRWRDAVELEDPIALIDALAAAGAAPQLVATARYPSLVYAHARSDSRRWAWYRLILKFPIFALLPTLPLFRVHQLIAYGGAFGEYHQYGLDAYLAGFAIYWATLTIYLMVYAAALRAPIEMLAVGSAVLLPQSAPGIRRILERVCTALYYGGVPAAVVLRFLPW